MARAFVAAPPNRPATQSARRAADVGAYIHSLAINEKMAGELSAAGVASHFRCNPVYLNRVFRRETGTTIGHRITLERIGHARYLLSTGYSVKEAAQACGYANSKYFARQLREQTGESPSAYRQSNRF